MESVVFYYPSNLFPTNTSLSPAGRRGLYRCAYSFRHQPGDSAWTEQNKRAMALLTCVERKDLYHFNFLSIHMKERKTILCLGLGSNPGPLAPQSNTLTTEPRSLKQFGHFYFEVVSFCSVFGHFQPLTASEVTNNLRIELSDLNYI